MMQPRSGASRGFLAATLLLLAVVGLPALQRCGRETTITRSTDRGEPRDLTFTLLDGRAWHLRDHRGQVVAVNLWATWCGPCRSETPLLERVSADLEGKGFRVLGVSLDTGHAKQEQVRTFRAAFRITYPLAFPDAMSQIESGLEGIPTTLLFDRHGRAARVYVGELREASLRADITQLLAEP